MRGGSSVDLRPVAVRGVCVRLRALAYSYRGTAVQLVVKVRVCTTSRSDTAVKCNFNVWWVAWWVVCARSIRAVYSCMRVAPSRTPLYDGSSTVDSCKQLSPANQSAKAERYAPLRLVHGSCVSGLRKLGLSTQTPLYCRLCRGTRASHAYCGVAVTRLQFVRRRCHFDHLRACACDGRLLKQCKCAGQ